LLILDDPCISFPLIPAEYTTKFQTGANAFMIRLARPRYRYLSTILQQREYDSEFWTLYNQVHSSRAKIIAGLRICSNRAKVFAGRNGIPSVDLQWPELRSIWVQREFAVAIPVMAGSKGWIHAGRAQTGWGSTEVCNDRKVLACFEGIPDWSGKGWSGFERGLQWPRGFCKPGAGVPTFGGSGAVGSRSAGAQVAVDFLTSPRNPPPL
jgi:hypothetical protein